MRGTTMTPANRIYVIIIILLCITITSNFAQIRDGKTLATGNVSYVFLSNDATGNTMEGWSAGLTIDFMTSSNFSVGFGFLYGRAQDTYTSESVNTASDFTYFPLGLTLKYIFVSKSNFQPYIGFNLGWHYSDIQTVISTPDDVTTILSARNGATIGVPIGLFMFVSKTVYINAGVSGIWLDNTPFKNSLNWGLYLGVGITY
jgi:outer membrane protein W